MNPMRALERVLAGFHGGRRVSLIWTIIPALLLILVVGGCSSPAVAREQSQPPVKTNQVTMPESYRFDPSVIEVPVGTTVTWTNKDNFTHNVHFLDGDQWRSDPLHPGMSASHTFTQVGTFRYQCDFHSQQMTGKVIVTAR